MKPREPWRPQPDAVNEEDDPPLAAAHRWSRIHGPFLRTRGLTHDYSLLLFCGLYTEDAEAVSVFAFYLLYPRLNVASPHLLVRFFARILKDQKAIGSSNIAFDSRSFVVTACDQFTAARLDSIADLVNATGFVTGLIGNIDCGHFEVRCIALSIKHTDCTCTDDDACSHHQYFSTLS